MRSLQIESERIRAKGSSEELTAGQASTLARNEQVIDRLKEEVSTCRGTAVCRKLHKAAVGQGCPAVCCDSEQRSGTAPRTRHPCHLFAQSACRQLAILVSGTVDEC